MNYNYSSFSLIFDKTCLDDSSFTVFNQYDFLIQDNFIKGHISTSQIASFILEFDSFNTVQSCILEWDYEYIISTNIDCAAKNTTNLFYNKTSIPDAWHLDFITTNHQYYYPDEYNDDVDLWILDTGINWKHNELIEHNITDLDQNFGINNLTSPHGTGTCCAAVGLNYGTSAKIPVYNMPVCKYGGSCGSSDIDKGLKTVLEHVTSPARIGKRSVINMSFGAYHSAKPLDSNFGQAYNEIFKNITEHGGIVVTSAGNSNQDACTWLYSYSPFVVSVGSIDNNFNKSGFSNWGPCVDIWMFGTNVPLAYSVNNPTTIQYKSGTSFSSPFVAGIIANMLLENKQLTKEEILNQIYSKFKGNVLPKYVCNQNYKQCCQSSIKGSRLDKWCRSLSLYECDRTCLIKKC